MILGSKPLEHAFCSNNCYVHVRKDIDEQKAIRPLDTVLHGNLSLLFFLQMEKMRERVDKHDLGTEATVARILLK